MRLIAAQSGKIPNGIPLRLNTTMYEIVPNLYLSAFHEAQQALKHDTSRVYVVNCTKDLPMLSEQGVRIPVDDDGNAESYEKMAADLPWITRVIHDELQARQKVVVHCLAGQQRSPTVIAAYLMRYHGYGLQEAIDFVRSKKRDAFFWNVNFKESLEDFSMSLNRCY